MRLLLSFFFFIGFTLNAQTGEIQGKVKDKKMDGEGLPFVNVSIVVDGIPRGTSTDMDGFYFIKPLPPGIYQVKYEYIGYETRVVDSIEVVANRSTFVDVEMFENVRGLTEGEVSVVSYNSHPCSTCKVLKLNILDKKTGLQIANPTIGVTNPFGSKNKVNQTFIGHLMPDKYYSFDISKFRYQSYKIDSLYTDDSMPTEITVELEKWNGLISLAAERVDSNNTKSKLIIGVVNGGKDKTIQIKLVGKNKNNVYEFWGFTNKVFELKIPIVDYYNMEIYSGKKSPIVFEHIPIIASERIILNASVED